MIKAVQACVTQGENAEWEPSAVFEAVRSTLSEHFVEIVGKEPNEIPVEVEAVSRKDRLSSGMPVVLTIHSVFADLDMALTNAIEDWDLLYDAKAATKVVKGFFIREHASPSDISKTLQASSAGAVNKLFTGVLAYFAAEYNIPLPQMSQLAREAMKNPLNAVKQSVMTQINALVQAIYDSLADRRSISNRKN